MTYFYKLVMAYKAAKDSFFQPWYNTRPRGIALSTEKKTYSRFLYSVCKTIYQTTYFFSLEQWGQQIQRLWEGVGQLILLTGYYPSIDDLGPISQSH